MNLPDIYIVIDFEASGVNPKTAEPCEVGAIVVMGGDVVDQFESLIQPATPVDGTEAQKIHGITDAILADAPGIATVRGRFHEWLQSWLDVPFVAHNGDRYDFILLDRWLGGTVRQCIDTLPLLRRAIPGLASYSQGNIGAAVGLLNTHGHRAMADVLHLQSLLAYAQAHPPAAVLDVSVVVGRVERAGDIVPTELQAQIDGVRNALTVAVDGFADQLAAVTEHTETLTCKDDGEEKIVLESMASLRKLEKAFEKVRQARLAPFKSLTSSVEADWRTRLLQPISAAMAKLEALRQPLAMARAQAAAQRQREAEAEAQRLAIEAQRQREEQARIAAEAAAAEAAMFGAPDVSTAILAEGAAAAVERANDVYTGALEQMSAPAPAVRAASGSVRDVLVYDVVVTVPTAVPAMYCSPDLQKIQAAVDASQGQIQIPGVTVTPRVKSSMRTR